MGEIHDRAEMVFHNRKKSLKYAERKKKRAEKEYKKEIAMICDIIFDIFDTNIFDSEQRVAAVWSVKLIHDGDKLKCMVCTYHSSEGVTVYETLCKLKEKDGMEALADNIASKITTIESINTTPTMFKDIYNFLLEEKMDKYCTLETIAANAFVVELRRH